MNQLLTHSLQIKDLDAIMRFPQELLTENDRKVLAWVSSYAGKYKTPPTVERLTAQFPEFVPIEVDDPDQPIGDTLDTAIEERRKEIVRRDLNQILSELDEKDELAPDKVYRLAKLLAVTSSEVSRYSTFDREVYFREEERLPTGFPTIDKVIGGFGKGQLAVLVGRLGTGKTTIALWMVHRWMEMGKRVMMVSTEMDYVDVYSKLDAMTGKFNPVQIRNPDEYPSLRGQMRVISHRTSKMKGELIIPSVRKMSPMSIQAAAQHLNADAIFVDGLYLLRSDTHAAAKWERISDIADSIKQVAMDLNCPILTTTQMKRGGDKEDEITAESIGYSDSIGQNADFIFSIVPEKEDRRKKEFRIIKNRHGDVGGAELTIDYDLMTITSSMELF